MSVKSRNVQRYTAIFLVFDVFRCLTLPISFRYFLLLCLFLSLLFFVFFYLLFFLIMPHCNRSCSVRKGEMSYDLGQTFTVGDSTFLFHQSKYYLRKKFISKDETRNLGIFPNFSFNCPKSLF